LFDVQGLTRAYSCPFRFDRLWEYISTTRFCCRQADAELDKCPRDSLFLQMPAKYGDVFQHTATTYTQRKKYDFEHTGVYTLVASNCGNEEDYVLSGSVQVMNAYGYLPAYEYMKRPFFFWLLIVYICLTLLWIFRANKYRALLLDIH